MPPGQVRKRMVGAAVRLLAEKGMEGTSFAEVLVAVDAPRGSVYHHFPGGKSELIDSALTTAGARALLALDAMSGTSAKAVVELFIDLWRELLTQSQLRAGCAVVAVTVAADDAALVAHAGRIFAAWRGQLETLLKDGGVPAARAGAVAATVLAACEGAVAIARAEQDMQPFETVAAELVALTERAAATAGS